MRNYGLQIYSHEDFIKIYYNELPNFKTYGEAYEYCESLYREKYGKNKYSSYVVFRATLSRYMRTHPKL
jgi:hypothetical protein